MKLLVPVAIFLAALVSSASAFVPAGPRPDNKKPAPASSWGVRLNAEGPNFFEWGSRFLNELLPWGDTSKGLWAGKREAMVQKYMEKTGCSLESAQKEVDEYLADKEAYIFRKRAEEERAKSGK